MHKLLPEGRWKTHPWTRSGMVRHCPLWILDLIADENEDEYALLLSGDLVHQNDLWDNIKKVGMAEPLLIIISQKNKTIKLETGDHRIRMARKDGLTHLPVAIQVIDDCSFDNASDKHLVDASALVYWDRIRSCRYPMQVDPIDTIDFIGFKNLAKPGTDLIDFVL